jgi:hypothetical protein
MRRFLLAFAALVSTTAVGACDSANDPAGSNNNGPLTNCDYGIAVKNADAGDFSEGCEADADCEFGVCLKPGDPGNMTNVSFGFCTRGCDCGNQTSSRLSSEEQAAGLSCLYPPSPTQHKRHVVYECASVSDCQAFDTRWNACRIPNSGGARKVCHAD